MRDVVIVIIQVIPTGVQFDCRVLSQFYRKRIAV